MSAADPRTGMPGACYAWPSTPPGPPDRGARLPASPSCPPRRLLDAAADGGETGRSVAVLAPPDIPRVHIRQRDPHHARTRGTEHQRGATRSRRWVEHAVLDPVVGAVEVGPPVSEQAADDRKCLFEPGYPVVVRETERPVLPLVPPRAEADDQPPTRDRVDGRRRLGQHRPLL